MFATVGVGSELIRTFTEFASAFDELFKFCGNNLIMILDNISRNEVLMKTSFSAYNK